MASMTGPPKGEERMLICGFRSGQMCDPVTFPSPLSPGTCTLLRSSVLRREGRGPNQTPSHQEGEGVKCERNRKPASTKRWAEDAAGCNSSSDTQQDCCDHVVMRKRGAAAVVVVMDARLWRTGRSSAGQQRLRDGAETNSCNERPRGKTTKVTLSQPPCREACISTTGSDP